MSDPTSEPRRFHHGRLVALVLALFGVCTIAIDLLFDRQVSVWTLYKALGASAVVLAYFYLVRYPRLRDK